MGPLISERAVEAMMAALEAARRQGGEIVYGGNRLARPGFFVEPALVKARPDMPIVGEETFAPILYVMKYETLDEAIAIQNAVEQGLTSAIFTQRPARGRAVPLAGGLGLRDRQRQYRHLGRRDRRRLRRREGDRRRPRGRLGRLESLHAPADLHDQLRQGSPAGPGRAVRRGRMRAGTNIARATIARQIQNIRDDRSAGNACTPWH